jgi:hypothetical protein
MAVGSVYKIGTSSGSIQFLGVLTTPCDDPHGDSQDYSAVIRKGDGTLAQLGWLQQTWHWDIMTEAQWTQIKTFVGTCAIKTRANSGTMTEYTAVLLNPENEPEHSANSVLDANVTFIQMIVTV